jgi:hypothetical protein
MSDIEPTPNSGGPGDDPSGEHPTYRRSVKVKRERLPGAPIAAGVVIFPCIILSAIFVVVSIDSGSPEWDSAGFCLLQMIVLGFVWNYLRKAESWGVMLAVLAITACFYLLSIGMCASLMSWH